MTTADFMTVWADTELRQYIVDVAKLLTTNKRWQADMVSYAWFILGEHDPQKTCEYYEMCCKLHMEKRLMELIYL